MRFVGALSLAASFLFLSACSSSDDATAAHDVESRNFAILDGTPDTTHEAIATVYLNQGGNDIQNCGGVIFKVDPDGTGYFLTAAYCLSIPLAPKPTSNQFTVLQGDDWVDFSAKYLVTDYAVHPMYNPANPSGPYNFGIVKFTGTPTTPFLPLTGADDGLKAGDAMQIYGFGALSTSPNDMNTKRYTASVAIASVTASLLYQDESDGIGTCQGDGGGPATVMIGGQEVVVGLDLFGSPFCNEQTGFARVSDGLDWINSYSGSSSAGAGGSGGTGGAGGAASGEGGAASGEGGQGGAASGASGAAGANEVGGNAGEGGTVAGSGGSAGEGGQASAEGGHAGQGGSTVAGQGGVAPGGSGGAATSMQGGASGGPIGLAGSAGGASAGAAGQSGAGGSSAGTVASPGSVTDSDSGSGGGCQVGVGELTTSPWILALLGLPLVRRRRSRKN